MGIRVLCFFFKKNINISVTYKSADFFFRSTPLSATHPFPRLWNSRTKNVLRGAILEIQGFRMVYCILFGNVNSSKTGNEWMLGITW